MDGHLSWMLVIIILCTILSAYFSATETAFNTFNRIRMKGYAEKGNKKAKRALKLADNYETLISIDDIGEKVSKSIIDFFSDDKNLELIEKLKVAGVNMESTDVIKDDRFIGKTFVLTGTLPTLKRDEATKIIESFGGKTSSSVSKKTDFVLAGEEAGSKLEKAKMLGIDIIDEDAFLDMIK